MMNSNSNPNQLYAKPVYSEKPTAQQKAKQRPFASLPKPPQPKPHSVKCCGRR